MTTMCDFVEEIRGFLDGEMQRQPAGWSLSYAVRGEPVPVVELWMAREMFGETVSGRRDVGLALLEASRDWPAFLRAEIDTMRHCLVFRDPAVQARRVAS